MVHGLDLAGPPANARIHLTDYWCASPLASPSGGDAGYHPDALSGEEDPRNVYAAPELLRARSWAALLDGAPTAKARRAIAERALVYSVAVICWECLAQRPPWEDVPPSLLVKRVCGGDKVRCRPCSCGCRRGSFELPSPR